MYCLTHGVIQRSVPVRFHLKSDLAALNLRSSFLDFRSEEHTSELQSHSDLVCRLLLEKKKNGKLRAGPISDSLHLPTDVGPRVPTPTQVTWTTICGRCVVFRGYLCHSDVLPCNATSIA